MKIPSFFTNLFDRVTQGFDKESYLLLISTTGSLCGLVQGFIITQCEIITYNENFINFSNDSQFINKFVQLFYAGELVGALLSFPFSDILGRKWCLVYSSLFCILMIIWSMITTQGANLLTSRFFMGWGVGILMATAPLYTAEISTDQNRGRTIGVLYFNVVLGGFCALIVCSIFRNFPSGWKYSLVFPLFVLLMKSIMMVNMPESPRWLLASKTPAECLSSMKQLRRTNDVSREFSAIYCALTSDARLGDGWSDMFLYSRSIRYRMGLSLFIQLVQQMVGIQIITVFGFSILKEVGVHSGLVGLFLSTFARLLGAILFLTKVDICGRRFLLMSGCVSMFLSWMGALLCAYAGAMDHGEGPRLFFTSYVLRFLFGVFLCQFAFSYSFSLGPCSWVVTSEIFPYRARAKASSVSVAVHYASAVLGTCLINMWLQSGYSTVTCLVGFGCLLLIVLLGVYCFMPETMGIMLEDMEALFDAHVRDANDICLASLPGLNTVAEQDKMINKMISAYAQPSASERGENSRGDGGFQGGAGPASSSSDSQGNSGHRRSGSGVEVLNSGGSRNNSGNYGSGDRNVPLIFIEPDTLHKYSNDMRENKFSYYHGDDEPLMPSFDLSDLSSTKPTPRPLSGVSLLPQQHTKSQGRHVSTGRSSSRGLFSLNYSGDK